MTRRSLRRRRLHRPHPNHLPGRPERTHPNAHALLRRRQSAPTPSKTWTNSPGQPKAFPSSICAPTSNNPAAPSGMLSEASMTAFWPQFIENAEDGPTFSVNPVQLFLGDCNEAQASEPLKHLVRSPLSTFPRR
ncbi:uncharacterized protein BO87DRAFT_37189 [Aspergillus neoniger CBS 115656]|uniref:Uncharacterized protein n=1 Tax=Aspergillus neoniger (strain CBS 115656) TaxID=1448310 RepID=A0A318YLP2_ASPNB|nr:hypothetical protein BO87DRAFT_37189 [Aspergillus neoniger CBS 115656]PYH35126.1 hypothetical protein BO87DRAFT_37189 [Aspergillus neoniger CBS 115656]